MKESDSTLMTDKSKIVDKFRGMFQTILLKPGQEEFVKQYMTTVKLLKNEPITEKIEMTFEMLKNSKTPREYNQTPEILKKNGKAATKQ